MEQQGTRPSAFAPPCPSCHEPHGRPRSVTVYAKQRIIQYVCEQCEHRWEMTTEAPTGLLFCGATWMKPGMWLPADFPEDESHIQHDGTAWIVSSHVGAAHPFEHLADAMKYANQLCDQHPGDGRLRVVLHRAAGPLAK